MAIWPSVQKADKEREFLLAWARCVYQEGWDAASDRGLEHICTEADVSWEAARGNLTGDAAVSWRGWAEENRLKMVQEHRLWGVPSLAYGSTATWGQDRLWVIERQILAEAGHSHRTWGL